MNQNKTAPAVDPGRAPLYRIGRTSGQGNPAGILPEKTRRRMDRAGGVPECYTHEKKAPGWPGQGQHITRTAVMGFQLP